MENKGYIICESCNTGEDTFSVKKVNNDVITIQTTLQSADVPNRNSRIYPKTVLENALNSPYVRERLETKTWYGEFGHPFNPDLKRQLYIDQSNISHIITKIWWEGNLLKAEVESANTARGRDFKGLIEQGCKVSFSLRAYGPKVAKRNNISVVNDPLTIFTYDCVIHPSHREAYMDKIIANGTGNPNCVMSESSDILIPVGMDEDVNSIIEGSRKINSNILLSESGRSVIMDTPNKSKRVLPIENYVSKEFDKYLNRLI